MGIKGRNEVCDIKGKYMEFDVTALFNRVYLGQISLLV
jgi:hypothetical protein